jgi:hypothetical protein
MGRKIFLIITSLLFVLSLNCFAEEPKQNAVKENGFSAGAIDLTKTNPLGLISILKERKQGWITVGQAPKGWIKKEDVEQLMKLIDSREPCASVVQDISSWLPFEVKSTVGNEVMFLIAGFRKGRYPPELCSVHGFKGNPDEYKKWWDAVK